MGIEVKLRPTIPFSEWLIAVNIERTKEIQNHPEMPAFNCRCDLCKGWKHSSQSVIPHDIFQGLTRLGIQAQFPFDLYESHSVNGKRLARAIYQVIGKVLSGPDSSIFDEKLNQDIQNYVVIRDNPWFSVRVVKSDKLLSFAPILKEEGYILEVDFRFVFS